MGKTNAKIKNDVSLKACSNSGTLKTTMVFGEEYYQPGDDAVFLLEYDNTKGKDIKKIHGYLTYELAVQAKKGRSFKKVKTGVMFGNGIKAKEKGTCKLSVSIPYDFPALVNHKLIDSNVILCCIFEPGYCCNFLIELKK